MNAPAAISRADVARALAVVIRPHLKIHASPTADHLCQVEQYARADNHDGLKEALKAARRAGVMDRINDSTPHPETAQRLRAFGEAIWVVSLIAHLPCRSGQRTAGPTSACR